MTSDNLERVALLPCPLCGAGPARPMTATLASFSGVEVIGTCHEGWPAVWCGTCGLTTRACKTEAEAITVWNTRASAIPVPSPMGEELQGVTGACLSAPGSSPVGTEAPTGLRPSGDDPSRELYRQALGEIISWHADARDVFPDWKTTADALADIAAAALDGRQWLSDSDGSPEGRDAKRLDGEAATARAEGIAQEPETPSVRKGVA